MLQKTHCWVHLDGAIKPYIIESLSTKFSEMIQTSEDSSSNTKFIFETSDLKEASLTLHVSNTPKSQWIYFNIMTIYNFGMKKLSESKSVKETNFLELILRLLEQKQFINVVDSHSKHPISRDSICLLRCLSILELVWKTLIPYLEKYDIHSLAARAFC